MSTMLERLSLIPRSRFARSIFPVSGHPAVAGRSSFSVFSLGRVTLSIALVLPFVVVGGGSRAVAQTISGTINGSVQDTTGAVIPGATVIAVVDNIGTVRMV